MLLQKRQHLLLGLLLGKYRGTHLVDQTRLAMGGLVPVVHAGQHLVGLMHHQHRRLGHDLELGIGDDNGHLDDAVVIRQQTGHFHVDPSKIVLILSQDRSAKKGVV